MSKKMHLTRGECMTVAGFYPGSTGGKVALSIRLMAHFTKFLSHGNRKQQMQILQKVAPGLHDHRIPAEENEELVKFFCSLDPALRCEVQQTILPSLQHDGAFAGRCRLI